MPPTLQWTDGEVEDHVFDSLGSSASDDKEAREVGAEGREKLGRWSKEVTLRGLLAAKEGEVEEGRDRRATGSARKEKSVRISGVSRWSL